MDNEVSLLNNKTISKVSETPDLLKFECADGDCFEFYHMQDCCGTVEIHSIIGNLQGLVGQTIRSVVEDISRVWPLDVAEPVWKDSYTWTTHTFVTVRGDVVTVRWLGESNGYYCENVYFQRTHKTVDLKDLI